MSPEEAQLDESMSTCRFSQRVAMVSNRMEINEEVDPKLLVARLKSELRELKEEIQVLRGEGYDRAIAALSDGEKERCAELVDQYVTDGSEGATLNPGEMAKVQYCFRLLRERAAGGRRRRRRASAAGGGNGGGGGGGASESEAMETLRMQLQHATTRSRSWCRCSTRRRARREARPTAAGRRRRRRRRRSSAGWRRGRRWRRWTRRRRRRRRRRRARRRRRRRRRGARRCGRASRTSGARTPRRRRC